MIQHYYFMLMQTAIDKSENEIICKYCYDNQNDNTDIFIKPCSCHTPICKSCFAARKTGFLDPNICEICRTAYKLDIRPVDHSIVIIPFKNGAVPESKNYSWVRVFAIACTIVFIIMMIFLVLSFIMAVLY